MTVLSPNRPDSVNVLPPNKEYLHDFSSTVYVCGSYMERCKREVEVLKAFIEQECNRRTEVRPDELTR